MTAKPYRFSGAMYELIKEIARDRRESQSAVAEWRRATSNRKAAETREANAQALADKLHERLASRERALLALTEHDKTYMSAITAMERQAEEELDGSAKTRSASGSSTVARKHGVHAEGDGQGAGGSGGVPHPPA